MQHISYPTKNAWVFFLSFSCVRVESRASDARQVLYHCATWPAPKNLLQCRHTSHFPKATGLREPRSVPGLVDPGIEIQAYLICPAPSPSHIPPDHRSSLLSAAQVVWSALWLTRWLDFYPWSRVYERSVCKWSAFLNTFLCWGEQKGDQPGGAVYLLWVTHFVRHRDTTASVLVRKLSAHTTS